MNPDSMTESEDKNAKQLGCENFLLKEEVMYALEALSVASLNKESMLSLKTEECLPEKVFGNLQKFKTAIQTVTEFAMKYNVSGKIEIKVDFQGVTTMHQYMICFEIKMNKNPKVTDVVLQKMCSYNNGDQLTQNF